MRDVIVTVVAVVLVELALGILVGRWLARKAPPAPPSYSDSADFKKGT